MDNHKAEEMKGRVKEAVGVVADDKDLKREGKIDQATANTKGRIDKVSEKIKDAIDTKD